MGNVSMKVILTAVVTHGRHNLEPGTVIELPEASALALINEERAKPAEEKGDPALLIGAEGVIDPEAAAREVVEKMRKALDDKYKRDPLAEAAKNVGVEFAYDATKAEIIDAVIAAGKADILIQG